MATFNAVDRKPGFKKDIKKLLKRYRTLEDDLKTFIDTPLKRFHKQGVSYDGIVQISDIGFEIPKIYKVAKFACKALKGRGVKSGIRIIYVYFEENDEIEFVEMYFKGDKENEDRDRIIEYYK